MLKKIVIFIFFSLISTLAINSVAISKEINKSIIISSLVTNAVAIEGSTVKSSSKDNEELQYKISQSKESTESTLPATLLLLFTALIGFVMLSNRWGV